MESPPQEARSKRIPFDRLLSRSYWVWRGSPALTVPTMFSTGLAATAESVLGVFGLALLIRLEGTSWLTDIAHYYASADLSGLAGLIFSPSFLLVVAEYMVPAAVLAFVVLVLAGGFVYSAEYGSYWQAQGGSHVGVSDVMSRFVEKWRPMAWTMLLSSFLTYLPLIGATGLLVIAAVIAPQSAALFALVVLAYVAAAILTIIFALFFVYTPVAVAAENLSGLAAIGRSWHQVRRNVRIALAYGLVYVVLTGAVSYLSAAVTLTGLPVSSLASVGVLILVTPVLHLTKTEIYSELLKPEPVEWVVYKPFLPDLIGPLLRSLWRAFLRGLKELKDFALSPRNFGYHLLSAAGLAAGWLLGIWLGNHGLTQLFYAMGYVPGRISPLVTGDVPFSTGVYIFFHNWQASLATALSGVWFPGIPFITLMLNGVLIGTVSDLVPNSTMLAAALAPHGIIELPSFVLAGSAGIRLGSAFIRASRRRDTESTATFHAVSRQTVYIVIGLALLFFIAGLIEGNVTPVIMRMAGWS